jgi:filamentous hemagglutinin
MNKNRYRIIFSQARGMFIAVAEIVKSKTKAAGQTAAAGDGDSEQTAPLMVNTYKKLNPLNFAVVSLLGAVIYTLPLSSMANTQIIADKSAPSSQQATVLNSSNGLTQVNIQTPSAGGVSRNTYSQFDVGQEGAILNNSRNNVQTQLGGWVQGNPWLGKGEAKVILNEVNSSNPSQLKGYLEVAGKSAQVVIANPSGLVCDGCGVINADRFSLAAGQAVVNQGYLESFRVRDGQVTIEGKGLNGSLTPYTDIYARALNVNAGLYANELTTVLGQNDIHVKDQTALKVDTMNGQSSTQTAKPDFALDVAQLGGMYAGKIFLVGTEAGLGVRNAGSINAAENQLTLNANGDLVNTGNIIANKDQIAIQAHNVANSGNISSTKSKIQVDAIDIQNSGLIATSDELKLNAQVNINNDTGVMNAGRINLSAQNLSNAKGQIQQTGQQELNITAKTLDNRQGVIGLATKDNTSGNQTGITAPPVTNPEQNSSAQDSSSITVAEPVDLTPKTFDAGQIQIAQGIHNVSGQILNNADIGLNIQDSIINNGGAIQLPELQFNGQSFENQDGQLIAQVVNITAHNVDNQKGSVIAGESFDLNAVQVNNTLGRLQSSKNLSLKTAGLENSQGQIVAGQQLNIDASQLNNNKGIIASAESDAVLNADHLNNAEGEILAQNLKLTARQLLNQQGNIYVAQNAQIEAADADNSNGQIAAGQALTINTQLNALNNQSGKMIANAVELNTGLLNNQAGLIQGKQSVKIDTNNNALINKDSGSTAGILSQGSLDLAHVSQLDNSKGYMASAGSALISAQNLNNNAGQISSQTDLNIQQQTAGGRIDNTAGQIQAQQNVHLNADTINNSGAGSHIVAGEKLTASANQVLNSQTKDAVAIGGFDAKNIEITAAELDNQSGVIRATDQANLNLSKQLNNQLGTLSSLNALNIGTSNKTLSVNNAGGELLAKNQLNLKANELMNQGEIISEGNIDIDLKQSYTHTKADQILANGTLKLNTENDLVNQSELSAGQKLELSAKNIRNETGASLSANDTHLTAQDTVHNQGLVNGELTHIQANKVWNDGARIYGSHVAIQADTLDNKSNAAGIGAVIASRGDMDLGAKALNNQSGGAVKEKAQDNAWIFSAGDLNIGGSLDVNLKAQGSADQIYNGSARIESLGDMYLGAKEIQNTNENLVIELIEKSREKITEYEKNGQRWDSKVIKLTNSGDASNAVLWVPEVEGGEATKKIGEDWTRYIYTNIHSEEEVQTTSPAQIIAGGNLGFDADTSFNNKDSQVLVGLAITGGLDKINNDNNTDLHRVDAVAPGGYSNSHTVGWNSKGTEHRNKWGNKVAYQPAPVSTILPIKLGEVKEYTQSQGNIDLTEQLNTQTVQRNIDAANTVVTGPLTSQQPDSQDVSIRTVAQDHLTLPSNALYITAKDSQAQYIVETDPAFANYKKWLSSDYMLDALGLDPAMQQKRMGDGFYEQRLVQDQVAQLTGFRFLEGYGSDEEQYKALMNNGLSFAKQYGLRVGIALSEAQIAQLTSDIVWLEEKTVKLADGTTAKTLVPQVYVKARVGDLKGDGTLISANSIDLKVQGNVFNSGTIAGRQAVVLNADNVELMNGRIQANQVGITTQKNLNIVGGQIQAEKTADLNVGGNFNLSSSIQNSQNIVGESAFTYTGIDRVAGIYTKTPLNQVSTDTENLTQTITIRVGGDAKLVGSEIQNANGQTSIQSQGDLMIGAIQTGINNKGYANEKNYNYSTTQADQGTSIHGQGTVELKANQIAGKAVDLASKQGDIVLNAQHGIKLENGEDLKATDVAMSAKSGGILARSTERNDISKSSQSIANQINAGGNIVLNAEQGDITAAHLKADAGETIQIQAKNGDVTLNSALNETSQSSTSSNTNFATYKNSQTGYVDQEVAQTQLTAGKNVDINAGKNIELQANEVKAGQSIYVGNTLMQRQADGTLKAADGSLMPENVTLSTLETHDQQWDEQQKGYRGIAKELIKTVAIGMKGLEGLAPGLKVDSKLTVGESSSKRAEQVDQTGSSLTALNIAIGSSGQTILTSADIAAQNTIISGQKVILHAAEEQNITAESKSKETIEGLGVKLNKDNIRLGGFVSADVTTSSKSTETTHKAGSIQTENLKIQGADGVDILGQEITATGDTVIDHGRGALNIGGYENKAEIEEKSHTETISTEVGVRNAYLDAALAVVAVKDAAKALSDAKDAYSQAQRDHAAGKITKEALDDSKANVAMATANLASAQIAVGAAAAAAAASTATYGFTIGANGERIETTTTTNTLQGEWQGSNLDLNNLTLKSENQDVNIQGSRVSATGTTTFDGTKDLNVTAGTEHGQQDTSSKTNSQSISYTYGGGGSASVGKQTSKAHDESLTHVNSQVELNRTAGSINKLNIQGGEVSIADRGSLKVNEIHVESLQDTATSSNSSKGGSIGAGFGSSGLSNVTAGYNQNKGNSDSAWVNDTSKLLIGNAQNNADLDAMGVKNVSNIGGVIANATKNSDGTLTDHGKLNYSSELELKDIQDHNYSSGSGFNVSTSIGIPQKGTKEASTHPKGSTTIGLNSSGQETEQLTKATMGQGTVNTTADTNRDINNTQEITRDQTTGMLDGSVTIDHRLLAESGREQIIQEQKDLPENAKKSAENIRNGIDELALKLPDSQIQNKILTSINQLVGDDLIANAYKEFINNGGTKEEFFVVAKSKVAEDSIINLAQANRQIEDLVSKGYSIEEILNTSVKKAGDTSVISIEGEYQTKLTADTTIGMQLLTASYDLAKQYGDFQKHIYEEYGVDIDPNTLSVIIGTILTGPAKTLANVLTSEAYQKYGAQYVEARKDQLANYVTASAYGTSPEKISVYSDPNLKEQISKESQETIDWSKDVSESKEGAKFLTNIIESMVVGGVGKGIAKTTKIDGQDVEVSKSNFEIDISQNNKHTEIIDFEKSKQKGTPENQMVNNLKANRHYELSNGTKFKTNEYGHVEEISFKPDFVNKGVRDSRQTAVGKLGEESDVGGHIQGCAMGGTCDRYNLFPQDANFNNSAYKVYFENILKKADKEGKTIDNVTVKFTRDDLSSVRPDKLEVTFLINGKPTRETFVNTAGGGK